MRTVKFIILAVGLTAAFAGEDYIHMLKLMCMALLILGVIEEFYFKLEKNEVVIIVNTAVAVLLAFNMFGVI